MNVAEADEALALAAQFAADGNHTGALAQAREAAADYRRLAAAEPDVYDADLASALQLMAGARAALDEPDRAAQAQREAVTLLRRLADPTAADPEEAGWFRPYLAGALTTLADLLDTTGEATEALAISGEAVGLYRQLAAEEPEEQAPLLAAALNNLAIRQRGAGQATAATATTRQAVNIYRNLAAANPEAYRPLLGISLDNLANMLDNSRRERDALRVTQELAALYREMAVSDGPPTQDPDSPVPIAPVSPFDAPLAGTLNNLAVRLSAVDDLAGALAATQEAAVLYRRLARTDPANHLGNLAGVLSNLAADLAEAGFGEEALIAAREAVDACRRLVFSNRPVYLPQLAQAVNNLAVRMHEADRTSTALVNAREAHQLYTELAAGDPDRYGESVTRLESLMTELRHAAAQ